MPELADFRRDEYGELKAEQRDRMKTRDGFPVSTFGSLAAVGALAGSTNQVALLLLVAPFCAVLGWNRIGNDFKVTQIGTFIRTVLGPAARTDAGIDPNAPMYQWETYHTSHGARRRVKLIQLVFDLTTFVAPGIAAVLIVVVYGDWNTLTWLGIAASVGMSALIAWQVFEHADLPSRRSTASG